MRTLENTKKKRELWDDQESKISAVIRAVRQSKNQQQEKRSPSKSDGTDKPDQTETIEKIY